MHRRAPIRPAHARTRGAHVSRSDVPSYEGLGPCPRHRIATCYVLGRVVPLAAAPSRRVGSKASTHRYLSFDAVTEHIASEMRLILRSDKAKASVFCRACLDLPSAACPTFHGARQVYARMQGWLTLLDATYYSSRSADHLDHHSAVLGEYRILL